MSIDATAPTLQDLIDKVLQNLGVKETGQPTSAEDSSLVEAMIVPVLELLNARDVAYVDANNIGNAEFLPVAWILARELAGTFSITDQVRLAILEKMGAPDGESEQALKDIVRLRSPRQTLRCEIFNGGRYGRGG